MSSPLRSDRNPNTKPVNRARRSINATVPWGLPDAVRYEMMRRLGDFVAESSEHFAEYTPWFIKRDRPDLVAEFQIPIREYIRRCQVQNAEWEALRGRLEDESEDLTIPQSNEFAPQIIHSIETDTQRTVYTNVPNRGHIENLPDGCIVEVPTTVDGDGLTPQRVGSLSPQLAALIQTNLGPQALTVEALRTGDRAHVYHAAMLDPHTAAELDLEQIHNLVNDLLDATVTTFRRRCATTGPEGDDAMAGIHISAWAERGVFRPRGPTGIVDAVSRWSKLRGGQPSTTNVRAARWSGRRGTYASRIWPCSAARLLLGDFDVGPVDEPPSNPWPFSRAATIRTESEALDLLESAY